MLSKMNLSASIATELPSSELLQSELDDSSNNQIVHSFLAPSAMEKVSNPKKFLTSTMIDSLKNKSAFKGKMVYGHVYNHQDHTHIHGHVHQSRSNNCQLDFTEVSESNLVPPLATEQSSKPVMNTLQDFEPQLVTICCDKEHTPDQKTEFDNNHEISHNHQSHHLHQCSTSELDLINSCFDFDFCDNVSCNDFVCDEYLHSKENSIDIMAPETPKIEHCPLFWNQQKENLSGFVHDSFMLNPDTNELKCVMCKELGDCQNMDRESLEEDTRPVKKSRGNNPWNWNECFWNECGAVVDQQSIQEHILQNHFPSQSQNLMIDTFSQAMDEIDTHCKWDHCLFEGGDFAALFNHINEEHQSSIQNSDELKPMADLNVVCHWGNCDLKFENTTDLTDHLLDSHIGSGKSEYHCSWVGCDRKGRKFSQRQKIIRHLHVHTKHKPFKCQVCESCFSVESMLLQHMRVHSGEKPFKCDICEKRFATSSGLSVHIRTHTRERPLACKYTGCDKRFSESSNLAKHMRTHEKNYRCEFCTKSFGKKEQLEDHMVDHEEKKNM